MADRATRPDGRALAVSPSPTTVVYPFKNKNFWQRLGLIMVYMQRILF
jgi:hypothetical protein